SQLRNAIRNPTTDLSNLLLLPRSVSPQTRLADTSDEPAQVRYSRIGPDRIECTVTTGQSGYLRVIESWDPGWSATVDGATTRIDPALGALLAVPLSPGAHQVTFEYRTPGARLGMVLSAMSAMGLVALAWWPRRSIIERHPSLQSRGDRCASPSEKRRKR